MANLTLNIIIGTLIVIINLLPLIFKKPKLLLTTGLISVLLILLLKFVI